MSGWEEPRGLTDYLGIDKLVSLNEIRSIRNMPNDLGGNVFCCDESAKCVKYFQ